MSVRGAIAQLGERLDRTQEVAGSSPASSIFLACARTPHEPAGVEPGSASLGILGRWTNLGTRVTDNEDSSFFKTDRLSPEDTWQALSDELGRVLMRVPQT